MSALNATRGGLHHAHLRGVAVLGADQRVIGPLLDSLRDDERENQAESDNREERCWDHEMTVRAPRT